MPGFFQYDASKHGIRIEKFKQKNTTNSALASLNIALKSYFSTAEFNSRFISITGEKMDVRREERFSRSLLYQEKYLQTTFHFHHFLELLFKDELRAINPVLAVRLETNDAQSILKLISGNSSEINTNTIEFSAALNRLKSLHTTDAKIAQVINKYYEPLKVLNTLRNKLWHRGTYVLRYSEFDQFVGMSILPCILECIEHSNYKNTEPYWKYKQPLNEIDPIEKIISSTRKSTIDFAEVAFYKAIGAASYNIPDENWDLFDELKDAEKNAEAMLEREGEDILECFVCGNNTLVTYREDDIETDENGNEIGGWWRINEIKCEACGLKLHRGIGEPADYGINISQIWLGESY